MIMPETTKNYRWKPVFSAKKCDRKSFRNIPIRKNGRRGKEYEVGFRLLRVCCPRGKWKGGKCRVGMKLQSIARRK